MEWHNTLISMSEPTLSFHKETCFLTSEIWFGYVDDVCIMNIVIRYSLYHEHLKNKIHAFNWQ